MPGFLVFVVEVTTSSGYLLCYFYRRLSSIVTELFINSICLSFLGSQGRLLAMTRGVRVVYGSHVVFGGSKCLEQHIPIPLLGVCDGSVALS